MGENCRCLAINIPRIDFFSKTEPQHNAPP